MRRRLAYSMLKTGGSEPFLHVLQENGDVLQAVLQNQGISTFSVFTGDRHVCLYYETANDDFVFEWEPAAGRWLENWPDESGGQTVVSMIDIFHDGMPEDADSWRGSHKVEQRAGAIARLKPEQFASYVFYHYQLQEERPEGFNKTYIIGARGTLLFSYQELPAEVSAVPRRGLLDTSRTPEDWHGTMEPHFERWAGAAHGQELWRPLRLIFSF